MTSKSSVRGQALTEFALVLPVLLLVLLALFDFGRAVYAFNAVSNSAREGARLAIVDQTQTAGVYAAAREAAAQATALGLDPADSSQVSVTFPDPLGACLGCTARVRVTYEFHAITPIIGSIIGPISVSSTTDIRIERKKP